MPTPRTALPFSEPFTCTDLADLRLTHDALRGWLRRGQVIAIGRGVYAPATLDDLNRARSIHINRMITDGRHPVSYEGAARLHHLCTPPRMPPRLKVPQRERDVASGSLIRMGKLLVPSRSLATFELARSQGLPGALVPLDCFMRNGFSISQWDELNEHLDRSSGWVGTRLLQRALELSTDRTESALESYSRGLMLDAGLPVPELQHRFVVEGRTYFADFYWPEAGLIGEADGEMKFDREGKAQYALRRRQGRLQKLGLTVVRWGWAEIFPDATCWLQGLRTMLNRSI